MSQTSSMEAARAGRRILVRAAAQRGDIPRLFTIGDVARLGMTLQQARGVVRTLLACDEIGHRENKWFYFLKK